MLIERKKNYWEFGLLFLIITGIGSISHFFISDPNGNFSGVIRLSQVISFAFIPILTRRHLLLDAFPTYLPSSSSSQDFNSIYSPQNERRRFNAHPKTVASWIKVANQVKPENRLMRLCQAITRSMNVDICLITNVPDQDNQLSILGGYDNARNRSYPAQNLPIERIKLLTSAINNARPFWFSPANASLSTDLSTIQVVLGLEKLNNMLVLPIKYESNAIGSLVLLSPFNLREWNNEDVIYFHDFEGQLANLLKDAYEKSSLSAQIESISQQFVEAQEEINHLKQENFQLENKLINIDLTKDNKSIIQGPTEQLDEETKVTIEKLQKEVSRLEKELIQQAYIVSDPSDDTYSKVEEELRLALEEVARLQNNLADTKIKLITYEQIANQPKGMNIEERSSVISHIKEINEPLSTIFGYTELLLGESVGNLGELQKKFLTRITESQQRIQILLNKLVDLIEDGELTEKKQLETIKLSNIVDLAIQENNSSIEEKSISLAIDIPDDLPEIVIDQGAFLQVLTNLMQISVAISSPGEKILMRLSSNENDYFERSLSIMVHNSGSLFSDVDFTKFFSDKDLWDRSLPAEFEEIGVNLTIIKKIVDANGGKIWVENASPGETQFHVSLPIDQTGDQSLF